MLRFALCALRFASRGSRTAPRGDDGGARHAHRFLLTALNCIRPVFGLRCDLAVGITRDAPARA
jgi:hypothetical protein